MKDRVFHTESRSLTPQTIFISVVRNMNPKVF